MSRKPSQATRTSVVTFQQIIERLLRSRLYRVGVILELDDGETRTGFVKELVYDGSNSLVFVTEPGEPRTSRPLPLSRITHVEVTSNPDAA
jgi:hypothetical protein